MNRLTSTKLTETRRSLLSRFYLLSEGDEAHTKYTITLPNAPHFFVRCFAYEAFLVLFIGSSLALGALS